MKILVNASNLGFGGATQVTDSLCCSLNQFSNLVFVVVLTPQMKNIAEKIKAYSNVKVFIYQIRNSWRTCLLARNKFLDNLVATENIDVVFSVFAPTWWTPKKPHLCGFALAHLVIPESPFFKSLSRKQYIKQKIKNKILTFFYWRCSTNYYTENQFITERVKKLLHCKNVYTVTNYYNQVFDLPENWHYKQLASFDGITLLTISNFYPHKNLAISLDIAKILRKEHQNFKFRFVFTIDENQFPTIPDEFRENFVFIGAIDISECPFLYQQCDIAFQPTLLECFTATYPEAMRMKKPIITTDLAFAKGLCGEAAVYYDALSAEDAAKAILRVASDKMLFDSLIQKGEIQLKTYNSYSVRVDKLIELCQNL